jgi:hypothetical protein
VRLTPPRRLRLFATEHCHTVLTSRRARSVSEGWDWRTLDLSHAECGGATDGKWCIYCYRRTGSLPLQLIIPLPGCDLACILDTRVQGFPCPAPRMPTRSQPEVIEVRPSIYHGGFIPTKSIKSIPGFPMHLPTN